MIYSLGYVHTFIGVVLLTLYSQDAVSFRGGYILLPPQSQVNPMINWLSIESYHIYLPKGFWRMPSIETRGGKWGSRQKISQGVVLNVECLNLSWISEPSV